MTMRPKTVRRLLIFVVLLLVAGGTVATTVVVLKQRNEQRLLGLRQQGMEAFARKDYHAALLPLSKYLTRPQHQSDAEALFAFGTSRARIETPTGSHVTEAIMYFRRFLEQKPGNLEGQHALLDLYPKVGYVTEAIELSEVVLAKDSRDVQALRAKTLALLIGRRYPEALKAAERWNEVAPLDMDGQAATYQIMALQERPAAEFIQRADAGKAAHPEDPRFDLLQAYAYYFAALQDPQTARSTREKSLAAARKAAAATPPDAAFVLHLVRFFDKMEIYQEAEQVLTKASDAAGSDQQLLRVLAQRLWQNGRYDVVVDRLKQLDPDNRSSDRHLLALRAASLYELKRAGEAKPIVDELAKREDDEAAMAWATALRAHYEAPPQQQGSMDGPWAVTQYGNALLRDAGNSVIRFWLGEAYQHVNEMSLAVQHWERVVNEAPSWAAPRIRMAEARASLGQWLEAYNDASKAYQQQASLPAAINLAEIGYAISGSANATHRKAVTELVEKVQSQSPLEPQTLPIQVSLKAINGDREGAIGVIRAALDATVPPDVDALIALERASKEQKLGMEETILQYAEKRHGLTPALASERAHAMAEANKGQDALAYLQNAAAHDSIDKPANAGLAPGWPLAIARHRESINDPGARQDWLTLGEQYPLDLRVQLAILRANSVASSRAFIEKTIERVRDLTDKDGVQWRMARAAWLLGSDVRERDSADAVVILTDIAREYPYLVEAHRLLATALSNIGNTAAALEQFKQLVALRPHDPEALMGLARLMHAQGQLVDAAPYVDRLAALPDLTPAGRAMVAHLYAQEGRTPQALEMLNHTDVSPTDAAAQSLRAQLLMRDGKAQEAGAIYAKLLEDPKVDVAVVRAAADFYASQHDMTKAQEVLRRLDQMPQLRPGVRESVLAQFNDEWGDRKTAAAQYAAAARAGGTDSALWQQLVAFHVRGGDYAAAEAAGAQAVQAMPNDSQLAALRQQVQGMVARGNYGELQLINDVIAHSPSDATALETLRLLDEARKSNESADVTVLKLRQLADTQPRFLPLQLLLIQRYLVMDRPNDAVALATRGMETFPSLSEPARVATGVYASLERWSDALAAAQQWRQRSLDRPLPADVAIAHAYLRLERATEAIAQLQPYLEAAKRAPDEYRGVLEQCARALASAGRGQEAAQLLTPLLSKGAAWRQMWMVVASSGSLDAQTGSAWLQQVAGLVPADDYTEMIALAKAWFELAIHRGDKQGYGKAREIAGRFVDRVDNVEPLVMVASASEAMDDLAGAEAAYRRILQSRPQLPTVQNNLAMVLVRLGGAERLAVAKTLADQAVEAARKANDPRILVAYLDTRARVQMQSGQRAAAIQDFQEAIKIQPNYIDALIGLASALIQDNQRDQAKPLLDRVDTLVPKPQTLSPALRRELEAARQAMDAAS